MFLVRQILHLLVLCFLVFNLHSSIIQSMSLELYPFCQIFLFLSIFNLICAFKCISPSNEIILLPLNVFSHTCFCHYVLFRLLLLQYCQTRARDSSLFLHCGFSLNSHRYNRAETETEHFKVLGSIFSHKLVHVFI